MDAGHHPASPSRGAGRHRAIRARPRPRERPTWPRERPTWARGRVGRHRSAHSATARPCDDVPSRPSERGPTWHATFLRRLVALDVLAGLVAGVAGWVTALRFADDAEYAALIVPFAIAWPLVVFLCDGYAARRLTRGVDQARSVGRAGAVVVAGAALLAFTTKTDPSRLWPAVVAAVAVAFALVARLGLRAWVERERIRGRLMQRTIVVGRADSVAALVDSFRRDPVQGLLPVGACASGLDGRWPQEQEIEEVPVLGGPDTVVSAVDLCNAEVVAVASHPDLAGPALRRLAWALEDRDVELIVAPGLLDVAGPRLSIRPSTHLSLLHVERPLAVRSHLVFKAAFDRCAAFALLVVLSPLLALVALAIVLDDPGPVFFRQQRVGAKGRTFPMVKFRTMVVDAESRLAALVAHRDGNHVLFKMQDDPRVTRVGRVLRRYSIDELPQLFNVLRGEMSLVGPRPPLPREVQQYEPDAMRRLRVRPGMTGLWQVSGRSDLSWEESLRLDLHYVDNWSLAGDVHILLRTVDAVVRGSGAY